MTGTTGTAYILREPFVEGQIWMQVVLILFYVYISRVPDSGHQMRATLEYVHLPPRGKYASIYLPHQRIYLASNQAPHVNKREHSVNTLDL